MKSFETPFTRCVLDPDPDPGLNSVGDPWEVMTALYLVWPHIVLTLVSFFVFAMTGNALFGGYLTQIEANTHPTHRTPSPSAPACLEGGGRPRELDESSVSRHGLWAS